MSILDPFEVCFIEVWPLPQFQSVTLKSGAEGRQAKAVLDALEYAIFRQAIDQSKFKAILNEKDPLPPLCPITPPQSFRGRIVGDAVSRLRWLAEQRYQHATDSSEDE
jgi:hypothetical protein